MQASSAVELIADRFMWEHGEWYDLATGERVIIHVARAGSAAEQAAWAEQCDMLARLRHPLLRPLVDYGAADGRSLFEAYAHRAPVETGLAAGCRLMTHAVRFLDAHAVVLTRDLAERVFRRVRVGRLVRGRPIGIVLQHRKALDTVAEVVESAPFGMTSIAIAGPTGCGLRTLRLAIARLARGAGYLPVCAEALARWPHLRTALAGRHVCLLDGPRRSLAGQTARARLLAALGVESTRGHLSVALHSCADPPVGAVLLDPLGVTAMTAMVHVDADFGPEPREIFEAARAAGGSPGRFLDAVRAISYEPHETRSFAVHETPGTFAAQQIGNEPPRAGARGSILTDTEAVEGRWPETASPPAAHARRRRVGAALARAGERAGRLAAAGRHAAALRLLRRAERVQSRRGLTADAGGTLLQIAWILRARGALDAAAEAATAAKDLSDVPHVRIRAARVLGVCWTDQRRFTEAQAALRAALAAAADLDDPAGTAACRLALARSLVWSGGADEAIETLQILRDAADPSIRCAAAALDARAYAATGELPDALRAARLALGIAVGGSEPHLRIAAHRAMAEALCLAGDVAGVREQVVSGLEGSRRAHLPLAALRLRAILLRALAVSTGHDAELQAAICRVKRAAAHPRVPPLLRTWIAATLEAVASPGIDRGAARIVTVERAPLEDLLVLAHRAPDDRQAVDQVVAAVVERLRGASALVLAGGAHERRILAAAGRPWRDPSWAAAQTLASGLVVIPGPDRQPYEAAAPVRHADEVVAALACRWTIGAGVRGATVSAVLRAASLAIAPNVRALLDASAAPPPPAAGWGDLLGESAPAAILREAVLRAARAPFPVLVEGESGTGKELVARAIHRLGPRRDRRFCAINCAAITDELVEAELFGHARGAFTGAAAERPGLFEEADGGTLFLDEIGELTPRAQAKLLRVLQDGEVRRVGENLPRRVDVRILAATNRRLAEEVAAGRFRADLRFRLDVIRVSVPPLRERIADIPLLATYFWQQACARVGSRATLGPEALTALSRYDWPGNVRELQNAMAWMVVHAPRRGRVGAVALPSHLAAAAPLATGSFEAAREEFERRFVRAALARAGGQRTRAAQALGISRQGLAKMMKRLRME